VSWPFLPVSITVRERTAAWSIAAAGLARWARPGHRARASRSGHAARLRLGEASSAVDPGLVGVQAGSGNSKSVVVPDVLAGDGLARSPSSSLGRWACRPVLLVSLAWSAAPISHPSPAVRPASLRPPPRRPLRPPLRRLRRLRRLPRRRPRRRLLPRPLRRRSQSDVRRPCQNNCQNLKLRRETPRGRRPPRGSASRIFAPPPPPPPPPPPCGYVTCPPRRRCAVAFPPLATS